MKKKLLSLFALFPALFCFAEYNQEYLIFEILQSSSKICKLTGVDRTNVDKIKGKVVIPATYSLEGVEYEVFSISDYALADLPEITHVVIEQNNEYLVIGANIFNNCSALTTVDFPANLDLIDRDCLKNAPALRTLVSRNPQVPTVNGAAMDYYMDAIDLFVPDESISRYKNPSATADATFWGHFHNYRPLSEYVAPDDDDDGDDDNGGGEDPDDPEIPSSGEITIDASMIEYTLSDNELTINSFKLKDFSGKVTIPATFEVNGKSYDVKNIGSNSFKDCIGLTEIIAYSSPDIKYVVSKDAFTNCTSLRRVELPNTLDYLVLGAFKNCPSLKTVYSETNIEMAVDINDLDGVDLRKTALFVIPEIYNYLTKHYSTEIKPFGKVLTTDDLENVIFTYKNYSVEFLHMMRDHSFAFAGCQVSDEESDCFSIEGNSLTINAAGGFRINAAELPDRNSPARIVNDDSPVSTVKFGGATLTLSNVEAGHQFIMSVPQNEALAGYGCDFVRNADNTYTVTVADPQQFSVASMDGSLVGISDAECNDDSLKVYSDGQSISVIGASFDSPVKILDFQGRCIAVVAASGSVALPRGVYLVVTPKKTLKVIL